MPVAFHNTERYANNRIECDHGRLKGRLRAMRGLKRDRSARVIVRGHALMQDIRRGQDQVNATEPSSWALAVADEIRVLPSRTRRST
jgi:transposase-like protein